MLISANVGRRLFNGKLQPFYYQLLFYDYATKNYDIGLSNYYLRAEISYINVATVALPNYKLFSAQQSSYLIHPLVNIKIFINQ